METKHTPGPWKLTNRTVYGSTPSGRVVTLHSGCDDSFDANARLISAAPELFGIVKECESLMVHGMRKVDLSYRLKEVIKKVEGK